MECHSFNPLGEWGYFAHSAVLWVLSRSLIHDSFYDAGELNLNEFIQESPILDSEWGWTHEIRGVSMNMKYGCGKAEQYGLKINSKIVLIIIYIVIHV